MRLPRSCRWIAGVAACLALALCASAIRADGIKLDGGGSLSGAVTAGSKAVAVRTSTGAVIVFDRTDVKQVTRGRGLASKAARGTASAKAQPNKRKLSDEEQAWMAKVRNLVQQVYVGGRDKAPQAKNALLTIEDPNAIPALSTYLGNRPDEVARHIYIVVLHNIEGPRPVYYLVAMSLYDPSPEIRSEAYQAIRKEQLDGARSLYVAALRYASPKVSRAAAIALGEIGDPRGESVPYLIDALVTYGTVAALRGSAQSEVVFVHTFDTTPGLSVVNRNATPVAQGGTTTAPNSDPLQQTPGSSATASSGQSAGGAQAPASNGQGTPSAQQNANGSVTMVTSPEGDLYDPPSHSKCAKKYDRPLQGYVDHPEVLDALLKITDQPHPGYGFNQDRWRTWWANERANRELQKPAADHVLAAGNSSH